MTINGVVKGHPPSNFFDGMIEWKVDGRKKIVGWRAASDVSQERTDDRIGDLTLDQSMQELRHCIHHIRIFTLHWLANVRFCHVLRLTFCVSGRCCTCTSLHPHHHCYHHQWHCHHTWLNLLISSTIQSSDSKAHDDNKNWTALNTSTQGRRR